MSLILDALNRSRREEEAVPGLATQHYAEPAAAPPRWRRALPWAGLGAALAVIAWLLLREAPGGQPLPTPEPPASAAVREQPAPREPAPAPAPPAAGAERSTKPAVTPAARRSPSPAAPASRTSVPPSTADPAVTALYRQPRPEPAPEVDATAPAPAPDDAGSPPQADAPKAPAAREEPVDIAKLVEQAESELKNRELAEHAAPFLVELSQHTKDQIPTIFYQRHDYAGDASRSTVVLNGKQLRVGGMAAPGVKVVEILPDSVVLSHDGREFRLRALNSWINL
jgi:general secretion pathway protein B